MGLLQKIFGRRSDPTEKAPEQAVIVHFQYGSTDLGRLFAVQATLEKVVADAQAGEVDGNEVATDGSDGFLYLYGPDADRLFKVISPILESCDFMKGATAKLRYGPPGAEVRERSIVVGA
jgi:hypothetical protein